MIENFFKTEEHRELYSKHRISEPIRDELVLRLYQSCTEILSEVVVIFDEEFKNVKFDNLMEYVHKIMIIAESKLDFLTGKEKKAIVVDVILLIILLHVPINPAAQGILYIALYYALPKLIDQLALFSKKINLRKTMKKLYRGCVLPLIPRCCSVFKQQKKIVKNIRRTEMRTLRKQRNDDKILKELEDITV